MSDKIVKLEILDTDVDVGDPVLHSVYLLNPNREKLEQLKKEVEKRLDYNDEDNSLTDKEIERLEDICANTWSYIYEFIGENFITIDVENFAINY